MKEFNIEKIPTANLTTGVFNFNTKIFPMIYSWAKNSHQMKIFYLVNFWLPMKNILLENKPKK